MTPFRDMPREQLLEMAQAGFNEVGKLNNITITVAEARNVDFPAIKNGTAAREELQRRLNEPCTRRQTA